MRCEIIQHRQERKRSGEPKLHGTPFERVAGLAMMEDNLSDGCHKNEQERLLFRRANFGTTVGKWVNEMSWHIDNSKLSKSDGNKEWWKTTYTPGDEVPVSGISRSSGCGREVTCNASDQFPLQNHHQHTNA